MSLVGNLADLPLTDIFQIVSLSRRTGVLKISSADDKASITFLNGNVIKASSTKNRTTLGSVLKQKGLISDQNIAMALEIQKKTREPFGTVMVREKVVPREKMETIVREYIQTIIVELLGWEDGHFEFKLLSSPKEVLPGNDVELILHDGIETQHLVIEGLRLLDEARHRSQVSKAKDDKDKDVKGIGFSNLMEDSPISLSEQEPAPPIEDNTGHPEGLWESLQDAINAEDTEAPAAIEEEPEELNFLEQLISEVGEDFVPEAKEPPGEHAEMSTLKSMVEELKGPSSLSEVLLLILRYAVEFVNRAALFVVNTGEIRGFGQFGLEGGDNSANDRIRDTLIPGKSDSILAKAVRTRSKVQDVLDETNEWDKELKKSLGGEFPKESVVLPVISNNQVLALLYGDNGLNGEPISDIGALEIFITQAGFVLDRSLLESRLQDMQG